MVNGLPGFDTWPTANAVAHVEPTERVTIQLKGFPVGTIAIATIGEHSIAAIDDLIEIPAEYFDDAITNKATLSLILGETVLPYIVFLPIIESEEFIHDKRLIALDGNVIAWSNYAMTEFLDVEFVEDIVYTGMMTRSDAIIMEAADEKKQFQKVLIPSNQQVTTYHIIPDGTYRYIRACAYTGKQYSLELHYRSRRPRPTNNDGNDSQRQS